MTRSEEVAKQLSKCGATFRSYVRSPLGRHSNFAVTNNSQNIRIYVRDTADFEIIDTNKKFKQAVLRVIEDEREILSARSTMFLEMQDKLCQNQEKLRARIRNSMLGRNHIHIPGATVSIVGLDKIVADFQQAVESGKAIKRTSGEGEWATDYWSYQVPLQFSYKSKSQEHNILLGIDDSSHFISMLPKRAGSVEQAHKVLRPAGLPRTAVRQGEWFFVPANKSELRAIKDNMLKGEAITRARAGHVLGRTHATACSTTLGRGKNQQIYAMGSVKDIRKGRHNPIYLDNWHRVVRNRELTELENSISPAPRTFD